MPRRVASGFLRHCGRRTCRGAEVGLVHREPAPAPLLHQGVPLQQWLSLVPMVGALLNLSAAMTNLAITIINWHGTTSDRIDDEIAR